jgi:metal-sulfur cluster biosynthetic enzyme
MSSRQDDRRAEVWEKLGRVTDPELDQSVTELDFIDELSIDSVGDVRVCFRLPTYWCAANFAFMMGHDMREAVGELSWVTHLEVRLLDHFYSEEINRGLAQDASFEQTCGGEAAGGLDLLRRTFRRKAFYARQERLIEHLRNQRGYAKGALLPMTVADLASIDMADDADGRHLRDRYLDMRRQGAPDDAHPEQYTDDASEPAFITASGDRITMEGLTDYLRHLRSVRLNSEFNAGLCSSVLQARKRNDSTDAAERDLGPIRRIGAAGH